MIAIDQPELEALILRRREQVGFGTVEETLLQAVTDAPLPRRAPASPGPTGADIIAAFQSCPVKDFDFEHPSYVMPISDPVKF